MSPIRMALAAAVALTLALPASSVAKPQVKYYLSLGDSWSQGVQPIGPGQADIATNQGFTDYLFPQAKKLIKGLQLRKVGCGGATTDSLINGTLPCREKLPYKSTSKATSQLTYAAKFIRKHKGHIGLITVIIGGNDVASCASKPDIPTILACVNTGIANIKKNLPVIASTLRSAAGPKVPIIGSTYANVTLGQYVKGSAGQTLATASVSVFHDQINPALKGAYAAKKIGFVDATDGFGGNIPFSQTTTLAPYGTIPVAVANICTLAWYCNPRPQGPDIHLHPAGYKQLAGEFLTVLKTIKH